MTSNTQFLQFEHIQHVQHNICKLLIGAAKMNFGIGNQVRNILINIKLKDAPL